MLAGSSEPWQPTTTNKKAGPRGTRATLSTTIADEGFDTARLAATAKVVLEEPPDPGNQAPVDRRSMTREFTVAENDDSDSNWCRYCGD